jgi:hypothetical protein
LLFIPVFVSSRDKLMIPHDVALLAFVQGLQTALFHASREGHFHTVQILVDNGADLNALAKVCTHSTPICLGRIPVFLQMYAHNCLRHI